MRSPLRRALLLPLNLALLGALACSGGETGDETSATQASTITGPTSLTAGSAATSAATSDASETGGGASSGPTSGDSTSDSGTTGSPGGGSGFCKESCVDDEDCLVDGQDDGFLCKSGVCYPDVEAYAPFCLDDEICAVGMFNGGSLCDTAANCPVDFACAAVEGYARPGVCARPVDAMGQCPSPAYIKLSKPLADGGEAVLCTLDSKCKPELVGSVTVEGCTLAEYCVSDDECATFGELFGQPTCDAQHQCVCTEDADCAGIANAPHCVAGTCACVEDRECPGTPGADACVDGFCGCSSARACPTDAAFDGTEIVCE